MDTIYDAKLLIVDDNAELLALLCEQLRGAGYGHIRTAQSCGSARACFAAEQPELMILEYQPAGWGWIFAVPGAAGKSGCPGIVPLRTGRGCRPSVWAGSWRR